MGHPLLQPRTWRRFVTTYFFAIFPEPSARDRTAVMGELLRESLGLRGTPVTADKLHLTCHFVARTKEFDEALVERLVAVGDGVRVDPFELVLTAATTFDHEGEAPSVLLPDSTPEPLTRLVRSLAEGSAGDGPSNPRPYQPHVTFLWGEDRIHTRMAITQLQWAVSDFVLAAGVPNEKPYRVLKSWRLARLN